MMMCLRGLVFDDPNGTTHLRLPTTVFNVTEDMHHRHEVLALGELAITGGTEGESAAV